MIYRPQPREATDAVDQVSFALQVSSD